tara:strand:- start:121 stop:702 length:582 start_codon:yes stop_codon:yes gene_type:complete
MSFKELYPFIFEIMFLLYLAAKSFHFRKKVRINPLAFLRDKGKASILWAMIGLVLTSFFIVAALHAFGIHLFSTWNFPTPYLALGVILSLLGAGIMVLAHHQMGTNWRIGLEKDHQVNLVARGIFRYSRNPIYLGLILMGFGIFLVIQDLASLILSIFTSYFFFEIILSEEKFLEKKFKGEYKRYKKKVRRFF